MKRTMLLVASVLVAAVGTGVVALWAVTTANGKQPAAAAAPVKGPQAPKPTPTAAPTTIGPGEKGVTVTLANPGLTPGQWIDVVVTADGQDAAILVPHAPVISVLTDGRVILSLPKAQALEVLSAVSRGQALSALLPAPGDGATSAPAKQPAAPTSTDEDGDGEITGSAAASPAASTGASPSGAATGSRSPSERASSTP